MTLTGLLDSTVLLSVEPYTKPNGKYGLDLAGRGRCASRKNMQLGLPDVVDGAVLQMAKWDDKVFHVDFKAPVTPLHAFGWALAQIDL
jgi:tubby-related protein 1